MIFDWAFALKVLPLLARGAVVTVEATIVGFALAILLGLPLALARSGHRKLISWPTAGFIEFVRSTPLLVQLYFLYFVLPDYGIALPAFTTGVIALGIHYACYTSEVFRAGLESVPKGQWDAAVALNLTRFQTYRHVVIPQMLPPIIAPLGNYLIAMFKETPLLSAITVMELLMTAKIIGSESFRYMEPITIVGALFLTMSLCSSAIIRKVEARMGLRAFRGNVAAR
jgi:polar amino acid transport system permease protein